MGASGEQARLRGHHFVCLQFYRGEGYSAEFVDNLSRVVMKASEQPALLVAAADDVCATCPSLAPNGTCADEHAGEAEVRRLDELARTLLHMAPGDAVSLPVARERIAADLVAAGSWRLEACAGCAWGDICRSGWSELRGEE